YRGMALVSADLRFSRLLFLPSIAALTYSAAVGYSFLVLAQLHVGATWQLYVLPVSVSGEFGTQKVLSGLRGNIIDSCTASAAVSANLQHDPSIGTSSTSILVVWSDQTNSRDTVRALLSLPSELPHVQAGAGRSISDISSTPAAEKRSDGSTAVAWSEYNQAT